MPAHDMPKVREQITKVSSSAEPHPKATKGQQFDKAGKNKSRRNSGHEKPQVNVKGKPNARTNKPRAQPNAKNPNQAKNAKAQQAANTANLQSIANRYQKPGGPRSFGPPPAVDVLTPTVPPIYPNAPKPSPLQRTTVEKVGVYKRFCQYVGSNYGVYIPRRESLCAFNVDRYTDRYNSLLTVNPDVAPRVSAERLPEELSKAPTKTQKSRKTVPPLKKRTIEDLPEDDDHKEETDGEPGAKKSRDSSEDNAAKVENIEEDDVDDADEELDLGTDYVSSYFDNGEGFLDSDHEGDEDGPIY